MQNTSKTVPLDDRDIFYFRQRQKNRLFTKLAAFYEEAARRDGITKRDIAEKLKRDPSQITRWLSAPSNLTLDTVSDLLLALGAEIDHEIVRFADRAQPNANAYLDEAAHTKLSPSPSVRIADARAATSKAQSKVQWVE